MFNLEHSIKLAVKLAAVALTAPATLEVASSIYTNQPVWQVIVSIAALILVEGALLLGWTALDRKDASTSQRRLYAALTIVAYFVLLVIAISHGEGAAGLAFRATLAVLIAYSIIESGILADLKQDKAIDKSIHNSWKVQRKRRDFEQKVAIRQLELQRDLDMQILDKKYGADLIAESKLVELEQLQRMNGLNKEVKAQESPGRHEAMVRAQEARTAQMREQKQRKMEKLQDMLIEHPDQSPGFYAKKLGVTDPTIRGYLKELQISSNGHR